MTRSNISSGGPYEPIMGYSRAVRVGSQVFVSGCTASTPKGIVGEGDPYAQAVQAIETIATALESAGSSLADVVRTRIYLTDMNDWQAVARAHGEAFGEIRPANTLLGVTALVSPALLVEIEADAVITE